MAPAHNPQDELYMQRALHLAAETAALASPNPQVGCVIVRDNEILGEGAHLYDNYDHAEIVALKQVAMHGHSPKGATAYVTLEPCSHHGRTGPCADALIAAGITRCTIATTDPNPLVSGSGIKKLRAAGIKVTLGVLEQSARDINDAFAHFIRTQTPFVMLKAALSADGKLAPPPDSRAAAQPYWLTGYEARQQVHLLRHASDAILTGIGTVAADDPLLTDRSGLPRRRPLLRVVLDPNLRIPLSSQLVQSSSNDLLIFAGATADRTKLKELIHHDVEVEIVDWDDDGNLLLPAVLSSLGKRKLLSVLLEGGSRLNGAFLSHDLVNKTILFYSPQKLGDQAISFAHDSLSPFELEKSLHRATRTTFGQDICVTGYLHDPWQEK
ncbi:bifunctional diaminohydroxyphosphoribosylaminopyrimidine deaminase/5-amino-6-(5-phosphoribosylamino)uracil reductase RibD [Edaphobacter albus]|uniref:bifunctional diaminohydroxyphosphoribosylaminopyrimidine deaminase/5-amino-6-(5-phosphoribosylamino)uracil reductase RibD n=1 Tax=Edaphobacter sp. 4G125 TaxID=2763071 RepID=UPI0016450CB6|nr:bifunctional diaminohydroxyphosphoribosylaminopyrimidine deaminase/5-amino-6-(5-phosphoribosylamino)uracil reductase RibD [Edaphobacter sp. 4G125]QNI36337.1 bifunctional diaminohydroxyphosphoribosylaminopyrimidine deaminase/5-amino-6-(5-phosphoribosylamino)uracil reductase RibD [Edaphobacter sp. 4G125]